MKEVKHIPGDLVIYTSLIKEPIAEICEVNEASYLIRFINGNSAKVTSKEIKPIPLTPEILEKNGWEKSYYGYYIKDDFPLIYNFTESFMVKIDKFEKDAFLKLSFVHQLQHRLFGLGLDSSLKV